MEVESGPAGWAQSGIHGADEGSWSGWSGAGEQGRDGSLEQRTGITVNSELVTGTRL